MKARNFLVVSLTLGAALLAVSAAAKADPLPAACGADTTHFKASHSKIAPSLTPPADQALVVLIQKEAGEDFASDPISRLALDGTWVGAVKGASYIAIPVSAGSHKLCVSRQSSLDDEKAEVATAPLIARAGVVYYFEFTLNREDIGFAERANGGAGGSASPAGTGTTPDMTAKRRDSVETFSFTQLKEDSGPAHIQKLKSSVWTTK
jgi:hypothetical protein